MKEENDDEGRLGSAILAGHEHCFHESYSEARPP